MLTVDAAQGLFQRDGETVALFTVSPARIRLTPTNRNPARVVLYRSSGRFGLCIFYYKDNPERCYFSNRESLTEIPRDDIPAVRKALRRFTRTRRSGPFKPPGKPFTEYEPPEKEPALKENDS